MRSIDWLCGQSAVRWAGRTMLLLSPLWLFSPLVVLGDTKGDDVTARSKHIIGATATIAEATSGLSFAARVDTGAATCSINAPKWKIEKPARRPPDNVGKPIRVLIKNEKGDKAWVDAVIVGRVRVRSSVQDEDDYHGRYKVRLPLEWNGVKKNVLVTINDRSEMDYPLLIGRNFLRGDFLVDVDLDNPAGHK